MTKPADRLAFVRAEFRALGRSATPEACQALVDSIGSDLRELASAVSQLVADVEGTIDEAVVGALLHGPGRGVQLHGRRPRRGGAGGGGAGGAALVAVDRGRARADHQRAGPGRAGHRQAVRRARGGRPGGSGPRAGHAAVEDRPGAAADARLDAGRRGRRRCARSRRRTRGSRAAGTTRSTPWRRPSSRSPGRPGRGG